MKRIPIIFNKIITGVYVIKCQSNGLIYIGSSVNIRKRWSEHINTLNRNTHGNNYLQNAWNKYGQENFDFSVLDICESEKLQMKEQFYLNFYRSYNRGIGFNIAEKAFLPPMSKESRKRQAESLSKNKEFIETCRSYMKELHNDSVRHQQLIDSVKSSQKVKDNLRKLNASPEHKKQVQELLRITHNDFRIQEHVKNMALANRLDLNWRKLHGVKNVAQYSLTKEFIKIYRSLGEVQKILATTDFKIDRGGISDCCKGKRKSYKGFIWQFVEDEDYESFIRGEA